MTTPRRDPREETPTGRWFRAHPDIDSQRAGLALTDVDWIIHGWRRLQAGGGWRKHPLRFQLFLEVKGWGATPRFAQHELLWQLHQVFGRRPTGLVSCLDGSQVNLWHYGVAVLVLSHDAPDTSAHLQWGRFTATGALRYDPIRLTTLLELLRFERSPRTLQPMGVEVRSHHGVHEALLMERTPLGLVVPRRRTLRY